MIYQFGFWPGENPLNILIKSVYFFWGSLEKFTDFCLVTKWQAAIILVVGECGLHLPFVVSRKLVHIVDSTRLHNLQSSNQIKIAQSYSIQLLTIQLF